METTPIGIVKRKVISSSSLEKLKKKKKKKRKGKRSSASSASAGGSPDSTGRDSLQKSKSACSCSPGITSNQAIRVSEFGSDDKLSAAVNESLRWVMYSPSLNSQLDTLSISGKFPVTGKSDEEEEERIAIYKMNRRKRYIAAQQALLDKYPDVGIYASSSSASSNGKRSDEVGSSGGVGGNVGCEKNNAQFVLMAGTKHGKNWKQDTAMITSSQIGPASVNSSILQFTHIPIRPNASVLNSSKDVTSYSSNYKLAVPGPNVDLAMGNLTNITTQA